MGNQVDRHYRMRRLWELQDGRCAHCDGQMPKPDNCRERGEMETALAPTLDHVIPRSRGGSHGLRNLVLAHRECNGARGDGKLPRRAYVVFRRNLERLDCLC